MIYLGNEFSDFCTRDCNWYRSIMVDGYQLEPHAHEKRDAANWAFFPLFPLVAGLINEVPWISSNMALLLTGRAFLLVSIYLFIIFSLVYAKNINPYIAGMALALNPYSLYGNVGYSEPIFLTLTLLSFLAIAQEKFKIAGIWSGLLTAARPVGIAIGFSFVIYALFNRSKVIKRKADFALGLALVPLGIFLFMVYIYSVTGDALAFKHVQVAWGRIPEFPLNHLTNIIDSRLSLVYGISVILSFAAIGVLVWLKLWHLAAFSFLATLIPLSTGLWEMPRYIWWQAPILFVLALIMNYRKLYLIIIPAMVLASISINILWLTYPL